MSNIHTERNATSSFQGIQAECMVKRNRIELATAKPGENDLYTICVKCGILKRTFSCNQFHVCPQELLKEDDVN